MAFQPKQNRNATSALGTPRVQATVYGVWLSGIASGIVLILVLAVLIGGNKTRTQQTARENAGPQYAPIVTTQEGDKIAYVEAWKTASNGADELKAALSRGQTNYGRICIGCHYGSRANTSNGPYLGDFYTTGYLYNGTELNDANTVKFILLGHGNMPAGIPLPEQAVDIMLYLKKQTCGNPQQQLASATTDDQKKAAQDLINKCALPVDLSKQSASK